jgi:predicted permease
MLVVLSITAPIFILIGLGFAAVRIGLVNPEQVRGMGSFVITFALPALVIKALTERALDEVLDLRYLLVYALGSLAVFALGFAVSRWLRRESISASALTALGMSVSNSGFIGYPIVAMALGPPAAVALALGMLVENLLMIPLALILAEAGSQRSGSVLAVGRETARRLLQNPLIIAISLGLALALLEVRLPSILANSVEMLARASAPVALFVIGGVLAGVKAQGLLLDVAQIALGKLLLHPLAVFIGFCLLPPGDPQLMVAGVLFASTPLMSIYPILGQRYGLESRSAAALVVSTSLAFFSMSALVALLTH